MTAGDAAHRWYVVRDIGTALGETGRLDPQRNDPALFERTRFINRVKNGAVDFNYHGRHQELADHIAPEDVRWMCDLLARLRIEQWRDAFRAGGYDAATAERFIARIKAKIAEGQALRGLLIRAAWLALILSVGASPCFAQDQPDNSPKPVASDHELLRKYVWSTLGLEGAIRATLASGLDQWQEAPPEWNSDATGYAKRWASEYAESAIGDTTKYAVARLFHHDPSFTRCECSGFARRLRHAVDSPFMARKRDGTRVLSAASLAGFLTGHVVSASTWYPAPLGARDGLKHAATSLVSKIGVDVFKEFRPRRKW